MTRPVYLDNHATTPLDPRVLDAMLPYFKEKFGNPHSSSHFFGDEAAAAVEKARAQVAGLIGAEAREIVFTSGATESNNISIQGAARFHKGRKNHIVTVVTEHKCVLESVRHMEDEGFEVTRLAVEKDGLIDLQRLEDALTERTVMATVMGVHNEIGVIQPLAEIGRLCREKGVYLQTDCAQAVGKIPLDVNEMNIDLMSISGHKVYGPKGIGALYMRRRPRARVQPLFHGGGQERGMRSGTVPAPLVVGLGEACAVAAEDMAADTARVGKLRDRLLDGVRAGIPDVILNGDAERRVSANLNLSFPGVDGNEMMAALRPRICVSSGSACTSTSVEPSYSLIALGLDKDLAHASFRVGVGRFTTDAEIDIAIGVIVEQISGLRGGKGVSAAAE